MSSKNESASLVSLVHYDIVTGLGRLFYVVSPAETTFEKVEDVPDFVNKVIHDEDNHDIVIT